MTKLLDFVLTYVLKLQFLDGYRMYAAGAGFMLAGTAMVLNEVGSGVYDHDTMEKGIASILAGVAIIGKAGKDDKKTAAIRSTT